jgi:hypothetical protein
MSSATCCMATLVSFPSRYTRVKHILFNCWLTKNRFKKRLRTINDHCDLVVDGLHIVINASHTVVDAGHLIVDIEYLILDTPYFIVDSMRGLQNLCSYHPDLFICQLEQPLQRIFNLSLSNQLLQVFF